MQGNCSETPPGAPLEPPRTSNTQCVISTSANLLRASKNLWIHDLYIEVKITEGDSAAVPDSVTPAATILEVHEGDTWLTSTVFVGERSGSSSRAVNVAGKGRLYARSMLLLVFLHDSDECTRLCYTGKSKAQPI